MPTAPVRPCIVCGALTPRSRCPQHEIHRDRSPAWQRLRTFVLQRDNHVCHLCHKPGADTVDHLTPLSDGGTDTAGNLKAAHRSCNSARGNRPL